MPCVTRARPCSLSSTRTIPDPVSHTDVSRRNKSPSLSSDPAPDVIQPSPLDVQRITAANCVDNNKPARNSQMIRDKRKVRIYETKKFRSHLALLILETSAYMLAPSQRLYQPLPCLSLSGVSYRLFFSSQKNIRVTSPSLSPVGLRWHLIHVLGWRGALVPEAC